MALWAKTRQLLQESWHQITATYGENFPIEVRHHLAEFIEDKFLNPNIQIEQDNPQHQAYVASLVQQLTQEIENKASAVSFTDFVSKIRLKDAAKMFKERYETNPMYFYNYIRRCLLTELKLIKEAGGDDSFLSTDLEISNGEIISKISTLKSRVLETAQDLSLMKQEQIFFEEQFKELTKLNAAVLQMSEVNNPQYLSKVKEKNNLEQLLMQKVHKLVEMRMILHDKFKQSYHLLNALQTQILDKELVRWKREQRLATFLAGNGKLSNNDLETIQAWCQSLAELIWQNRLQIKETEMLKQRLPMDQPTDTLPQLLEDMTLLLRSLVISTFIIEKQPPQVMKTNTKFTTMVRLLVGGNMNSAQMSPPQVKVSIISEQQVGILLKNNGVQGRGSELSSGEIVNNTGTMEYQKAAKQLSVKFSNMQLKKIKRAEKKGTESVTDEKFCLLFRTQFSVGGGELTFQVWALSLPVVVIVHGNQEPDAWATVTWDNAFAEPGRVPFVVPDMVPWSKVAEALTVKFKSVTGRALSENDLLFLAEKIFRMRNPDLNQPLSWTQFCKEHLRDQNFTFWEWFYAVMKLTRDHLKQLWCDGSILGFINKREVEELLVKCRTGTFLLRFSDSKLGGITIACIFENGEVLMLEPLTAKDLEHRCLADRIADLQILHFLYPDIPKNEAFGKYYTPYQQKTTNTGYVGLDWIPNVRLNPHSAPQNPVLQNQHRNNDRSPNDNSDTNPWMSPPTNMDIPGFMDGEEEYFFGDNNLGNFKSLLESFGQ